MKELYRTWCLAASVMALGASTVLAQGQPETPTYSNAQVISVDPLRRIVVLRSPGGAKETLILDDLLAGTGAVKAGDRVIVTVRGGPGRRRITAMSVTPSRLTPARLDTKASSPPPGKSGADHAPARARYSEAVASISQQAQTVDGLWNSFVGGCAVKPVSNEGGGRDWFGLWDGRVFADYSGGECRDLFNQLVSAGEIIKKSMAEVENGIETRLTPGQIREIRRAHSMNWDGWLLPAPQKREP